MLTVMEVLVSAQNEWEIGISGASYASVEFEEDHRLLANASVYAIGVGQEGNRSLYRVVGRLIDGLY